MTLLLVEGTTLSLAGCLMLTWFWGIFVLRQQTARAAAMAKQQFAARGKHNPSRLILAIVSIAISDKKSLIYTILAEIFSNTLEHGLLCLYGSIKKKEDGLYLYLAEKEQRLQSLHDAELKVYISSLSNATGEMSWKQRTGLRPIEILAFDKNVCTPGRINMNKLVASLN